MGKIIELTHDDVQNELAYALICETMEGAYWNSGRRRRMFSKAFTRSEQQRISNIKAKAHKWYLVTGVPEKVRMSYSPCAGKAHSVRGGMKGALEILRNS